MEKKSMNKKITFLELLQMIQEGKQPKTVMFGANMYDWQNGSDSYFRRDGEASLMNDLDHCTRDIELVEECNISFEMPEAEPETRRERKLKRESPEKCMVIVKGGIYVGDFTRIEMLNGGNEVK